MTHVPHDLIEDFPEYFAVIQRLKQVNAHFARLSEAYHRVNRAVHRAETRVEPVSALTEIDLRKERAALKDQLAAMLRAG